MEHGTDLRSYDDLTLHDHVALDEIELYAEILIAVADADRPLSPAEIDRVLGLTSGAGGSPPRGEGTVPRAEEDMPRAEEAAPQVEKDPSGEDGTAPCSEATAPRAEGTVPVQARSPGSSPDTARSPGPVRPPGPTGPTGPPPRSPEKGPDTPPPKPGGEDPEARTLPDTGPLFPDPPVLPEALPFTGALPVRITSHFTMRTPSSGSRLTIWPL